MYIQVKIFDELVIKIGFFTQHFLLAFLEEKKIHVQWDNEFWSD